MPRDIPVGNGSLLVNFDRFYSLRDLYWPYVGQENHTEGRVCRFGVWVDGQFTWIGKEGWLRTLAYEQDTLVTQVTLYNPALSLRIICRDTVDFYENLYPRKRNASRDRTSPSEHRDDVGMTVDNLDKDEREVRLFFAHDFHISPHSGIYDGNEVGDSAYYEPERLAVFHYKGRRLRHRLTSRYERTRRDAHRCAGTLLPWWRERRRTRSGPFGRPSIGCPHTSNRLSIRRAI